jgi:hypothetical protein
MAHVGVEGFAAGSAENDLGEDEKAGQAVAGQKINAIPGAERLEDFRVGGLAACRDENETPRRPPAVSISKLTSMKPLFG